MLDIIIPVFNEKENIIKTLTALHTNVKTPFRILICYDHDNDNTLPAIANYNTTKANIQLVKNTGQGVHMAIQTGFAKSTAPFVLVYPADDDFNAGIVDHLIEKAHLGFDIVCPSRFMKGGKMQGAPLLKSMLLYIANFILYHFARIGVHDASNGFRLFSRRVITKIPLISNAGFTYSIELLIKVKRLGWPVTEIPAVWYERTSGKSRFRLMQWLPAYLRWFIYAFATLAKKHPKQIRLANGSVPHQE